MSVVSCAIEDVELIFFLLFLDGRSRLRSRTWLEHDASSWVHQVEIRAAIEGDVDLVEDGIRRRIDTTG